ncbi:MAG: hypothetical protein HY841_04180 [Bacteroidetes bacterium]|nr:hypothetical protein [Bacteroidota bacterium]
MPTPNISAVLSNADKAAIITNTDNSKALMPFTVNLDPAARKRLRKTGSKREGYVLDVYNGVLANPSAIPADFSIAEWTKDEDLNKQLVEVREEISSLLEAVDDTILLIGSERIHQADTGYGFLKQSAKGNSALTTLVQRIARQFLGQGREGRKTTFTIPAGGQVSVTDVAAPTPLLNIGTTILSIVKTGSGSSRAAALTVNPGESVAIDSTSISVTNTGTSSQGVFTVKLKPSRV